jgi:hypothetical protein
MEFLFKVVDCGLILEKMRVLCAKVTGIPWTKSLGMWTDEKAPVHGSTVDRSGYPFGVLIWSVQFGFDG